MSAMTVRMDRIFTKKGKFNLAEFDLNYFDPYRFDDSNVKHTELYDLIFDEDGNVHSALFDELEAYIKNKKFGPFSDAVMLFYAQKHGRHTNNSYPANYMWR